MKDYKKERYYDIDEKKYQKYAGKWLKAQPGYGRVKAVETLLYFIGILSPVIVPLLLMGEVFWKEITFLLIGLGIGSITGAIFLCIGRILGNFGKRKYGGAMLRMERQFLFTNYSGIQFGYHDGMDKNPQSMVVNQISYENILFVSVNRNMRLLCICGNKEVVEYDDLIENRIRNSYTKGQFGDAAEFYVFLCFDREEEFMDILRAHDVTVKNI